MPVWHEATRDWVRQGKLVLLGVIQEQHPQRCRLYAQWKQFDWPILHDPINLLRTRGVPMFVAVDEWGIVRGVGPKLATFGEDFVERRFPPPAGFDSHHSKPLAPPNLDQLRRETKQSGSADAWRRLGDAVVLWQDRQQIDEAIAAYRRAAELAPGDGMVQFRLGVAYRMRYESSRRQPGDFQTAIDCWTAARRLDPNQYIWRRRIEQYGPRLSKPYPFYDWVEQARADVLARGEQPVVLPVAPSGAEIARPIRRFAAGPSDQAPPDPDGQITRDTGHLIESEVTLVPPRVRPGRTVRVHVTLRPDAARKVFWNNEVEPLRLWVDSPTGWQLDRRLIAFAQPRRPETSEARQLEFEIKAPAAAKGRAVIRAYALYYVCEDVDGKCLFLRQDIPIDLDVAD